MEETGRSRQDEREREVWPVSHPPPGNTPATLAIAWPAALGTVDWASWTNVWKGQRDSIRATIDLTRFNVWYSSGVLLWSCLPPYK